MLERRCLVKRKLSLNKIIPKDIYKLLWNIIIVFIVFIGVLILNKEYFLVKYTRYTIGVVTNTKSSPTFTDWMYYSFEYNNIKYAGSSLVHPKYIATNNMRERYFIKFSYKHPHSNSEILVEILVPDSIQTAPIMGWEKLPIDP